MTEAQVGAVAPEVPVVPASTDAPAPESTADQSAETKDQPAAVKPEKTEQEVDAEKAFQKRLGIESRRLQRTLRAEIEAEFYKRELENQRQPAQAAQQATGEPDPKDYKDFESYNAALIAHRVDRALAERLAKQEKETTAQHTARTERERGEALTRKLADAEAKHPDFREVIADDELPFNGAILAYIEDSKGGGDVAYHLAQNRSEAQRIAALSPIQQVIALHALEAKLSAPPTTTKAPPPITPSGTKATVEKDWSELTDKEFAERRRRQIAQKR